MNTVTSATMGILFVAIAAINTYLMYHLWGYPYDGETRTSKAPRALMLVHRGLGYVFVIVYVLMMIRMVPRMWNYQVELPARTVAHLMLGFTIGFLLLIKISIFRFFRHLEEWFPVLGTSIFLCTVLLAALSVPFAFREAALAAQVPGGHAFSEKNLTRVQALLPRAGFPEEANLDELASPGSLHAGREVLLGKCVRCHDLKTVLMRPRTPSDWVRTVTRMGQKPDLFEPISQNEQWQAAAYLVAITPDLQKSSKQLRGEKLSHEGSENALRKLQSAAETAPAINAADAQKAFEQVCSECHESSDIEDEPLESAEDVDDLIKRMVGNGLEAEKDALALIRWYLNKKYVTPPTPASDEETE